MFCYAFLDATLSVLCYTLRIFLLVLNGVFGSLEVEGIRGMERRGEGRGMVIPPPCLDILKI
jgi:hypothetical protein